jgi:hypothetical protein
MAEVNDGAIRGSGALATDGVTRSELEKIMKATELAIVAGAHLVAFAVAAAVIRLLGIGDPGLALIAGASLGAGIAAMLYHRRNPDIAPFAVKAAAGGVLSCMAVITGVLSQLLLKWMTCPEVVIPISAIGSFFFPWAVFNSMRNACLRKP